MDNILASSSNQFHGYTPPANDPAPAPTTVKEPPVEPMQAPNQAAPQGVAAIATAPQPGHIQNNNAFSVPTSNQLSPEQMEQMKLMQTGQRMAQELNQLSSHLSEPKFLEIAHAMESHPVSQHIQREMAETAIASMMGINFVVKAHLTHPEVPVAAFANDAMMLIGNFKYGQRPENGVAGLEQQFGVLSKHYGLDKLQLQPAAVAPNTPSLAPEGLANAPRTPSVPSAANNNFLAANSNILASSAVHQGKVAQPLAQHIA